MEKTRVPKGEEYGYVDECGYLTTDYDEGRPLDDIRYEVGNYFNLKDDVDYKEAESMARKLRAVLKGAEVIEMPSEKEMQTLETKDIVLAAFLEESLSDLDMITHGRHAYWKGWNTAICWLKSKIVK